jgi:hypothetical protein
MRIFLGVTGVSCGNSLGLFGFFCCFFGGYLWGFAVFSGLILGFLIRFFYDNGYGDAGSEADGGTKSVIIIIVAGLPFLGC